MSNLQLFVDLMTDSRRVQRVNASASEWELLRVWWQIVISKNFGLNNVNLPLHGRQMKYSTFIKS